MSKKCVTIESSGSPNVSINHECKVTLFDCCLLGKTDESVRIIMEISDAEKLILKLEETIAMAKAKAEVIAKRKAK